MFLAPSKAVASERRAHDGEQDRQDGLVSTMDGSKNYIEKRAKTRRDLSWDAAIVDSFGQPVSRCCVVNISATGAQLLLQEAAELPEDFTLLLSHKGEVRRQCRVAWQDDKNVGVSFVRSRSAARDAQRRSTTDRPESRG